MAIVLEEESEGVSVGGVHVGCDAGFGCRVVGLSTGLCHLRPVLVYQDGGGVSCLIFSDDLSPALPRVWGKSVFDLPDMSMS